MDGDVLYAILMSFGWLFLVGWLALLLIACRLAFRSDDTSAHPSGQSGFANPVQKATGRGTSWNLHLRG